jgi:phosphohistidine phosphatase
MRRLLLLRHAKAERSQPGGGDHDRVLAARGRGDAKTLGAYLARHSFIPDRAVVSTAARTRETWTLLAAAMGKMDMTPPVSFEERIYDASPETILQAIKETGPDTGTLMIIGHNPGLQELAAMLVASGDIEARERLGREFPTSALVVITFAVENWNGVHSRGGRLEHFLTPAWLAAATD